MSTSDPNEPAAQASRTESDCAGTFLAHHNGEDGMGLRSMTVGRYEEIRRRLADGRGIREIARALGCSRDTVREVRDGVRQSPDAPTICNDPLWMQQVNWPAVVHDLGFGHPLKFIWEETASSMPRSLPTSLARAIAASKPANLPARNTTRKNRRLRLGQ